MSVLLEYHSLEPVASEAATQIANEQRQLLQDRCYWSEPLQVQLEQPAPARLIGGNSLFNSGGYTSPSGKWMVVSQEEDYLMAWSDTAFIVQRLAAWSSSYDMSWSIYSAGDHIGDVVHGEPDKGVEAFLAGLLEASGLGPQNVPEINLKFANRCEPPPMAAASKASIKPSTAKKPWWRMW